MNCKEFNYKINDFIYEKITDPMMLKDFIEHFKECESCREEAQITYSMLRTLDDIKAPTDKDFGTDYDEELNYIVDNNVNYLKSEHKKNYYKVLLILILLIFVLVMGIVYTVNAGL